MDDHFNELKSLLLRELATETAGTLLALTYAVANQPGIDGGKLLADMMDSLDTVPVEDPNRRPALLKIIRPFLEKIREAHATPNEALQDA